MNNENLTPELIEKAKGKTAEELVELAQEEGIELTDEQLERVYGGWTGADCPNCGSSNNGNPLDGRPGYIQCYDCNHMWPSGL